MFSLALAGRDLALRHNPAQVCSKMHTHECGAREKGAAKQTSMRACNRLERDAEKPPKLSGAEPG